MDQWTEYCGRWLHCQRCPLGATARRHVLGRGELPCEVLMIGLAPGPVEDSVGEAFVGDAGRALDQLTEGLEVSIYRSNLVACLPLPEGVQESFRDPVAQEIQACAPRVVELIELAQPVGLVLLGDGARVSAPKRPKLPRLALPHPSRLMRLADEEEVELGDLYEFKMAKRSLVKWCQRYVTERV